MSHKSKTKWIFTESWFRSLALFWWSLPVHLEFGEYMDYKMAETNLSGQLFLPRYRLKPLRLKADIILWGCGTCISGFSRLQAAQLNWSSHSRLQIGNAFLYLITVVLSTSRTFLLMISGCLCNSWWCRFVDSKVTKNAKFFGIEYS